MLFNIVKPEKVLVTIDEKIIELFKLLKQLESRLKTYINNSAEPNEWYKMKKSMK